MGETIKLSNLETVNIKELTRDDDDGDDDDESEDDTHSAEALARKAMGSPAGGASLAPRQSTWAHRAPKAPLKSCDSRLSQVDIFFLLSKVTG